MARQKTKEECISLIPILVLLTILITLFGMSIIGVSGAAGEAGVNVTGVKGRINVSVNNTSNQAIYNASVYVYNGSVLTESGNTDEAGMWLSSALDPWNYTVNATAPGHNTTTANVTVTGGEIVYANLTLNATQGRINLTVQNTAGQRLLEASTFVFDSTGATLIDSGTADEAGTWLSMWLDPATYVVEAAKFGYTTTHTSTSVSAGAITYVTLTLSPSGTPAEEEVPSGAGGGGGGGGPVNLTRIDITEYPENLSMKRGESKAILIKVKNLGYSRVNNIILKFEDLLGKTEVSPEKLEYLDPAVQQTFLANIYILENAETSIHNVTLKAVCDETYDSVTIKFDILKLPVPSVDVALKSEIDNLREVIKAVWNETLETQQEGKDVTEVFKLLNEGNDSLDVAESYWRAIEYAKTRDKIDLANNFLKSAVTELTKMRAGIKGKISIFPLTYIGLFAGIVGVMFTLVYLKMLKYEQILNIYNKVKRYRIIQKREVLTKKLKALEDGHKLGYISRESYLRDREKILASIREVDRKLKG